MRRKFFIALMIFGLAGCSQVIENPIADYTWPVIQALMSYQDSVHYVHVGKTFSGSQVEEMVANQDSLYFSDARVFMDIPEGRYAARTVELERIDTLVRETGALPPAPYVVYRTCEHIEPGYVTIRVEIPELSQYAQAVVGIRNAPAFSFPDPLKKKELDLYGYPARIFWDGYEEVRETVIRMWYVERFDNSIDTCYLDWRWIHSDFILDPEDWLDYIQFSLKADKRIHYRRLLWVDILASGGNNQWSNYLKLRDVVFDLISHPYTSSSIAGAYGFVGSRAKGGLFEYDVDQEFLDSLTKSSKVAHLKFIHF